ncbi:hypothetical protein [Fibrella aquatilis]|uniref:Uncharacterized protein n=1 Tax=Fibrella aquatilis TaxID=2817059 RepID=A0A939G7I8_9BACT|nr:hypothetical protein [Fibrella aquatilis]MBO0931815.1 hypothetical protein [Fibrella aquatilis]
MSTLEQFKKHWEPSNKVSVADGQPSLDEASLRSLVTTRVRTHTKASFRYFWASFTLQLLVYAMCSHLLIRYWPQPEIRLMSLLGILLYLPFTSMLMSKFKRVATGRLAGKEPAPIRTYLSEQYELLNSFFTFKKRYEWGLIPVSAAIGVFLTFKVYVPGGVQAFPVGAILTYAVTLLSCYGAIRAENQKSFVGPLQHLQALLREYQA